MYKIAGHSNLTIYPLYKLLGRPLHYTCKHTYPPPHTHTLSTNIMQKFNLIVLDGQIMSTSLQMSNLSTKNKNWFMSQVKNMIMSCIRLPTQTCTHSPTLHTHVHTPQPYIHMYTLPTCTHSPTLHTHVHTPQPYIHMYTLPNLTYTCAHFPTCIK